MSDSLRVRGQETQVRVTLNGQLQRTFTKIENFTNTANISLLEKDYLGNTSVSLDEIFKGSAFEFSMDPEGSDFLKLIDTIIERASRRTAQANVHINIVTTLNFPNGQRPRMTLPDVNFSDIPTTTGGRDQYVNVMFSGKSESKPLLAGV